MSWQDNNNIEVKDSTKKCCFRYLTDEEIDKIIKDRIESTPKKGGNRKGSWTESEMKLRNSVILDLICNKGISRCETSKLLQTRWNIGHSTADRYIKAALDELVADYDEFNEYNRLQHLQRLEGILEDSLSHNDRKSALSALDSIAKVNGLYLDKKDISINGETTISFDFQ